MSRIRLAIAGISAAAVALLVAGSVSACSPPFEPSIEALGPRAVVVVGTIGERVDGGRLFHVERAWNGGAMRTPILIAFKEGEPIGDCSYPVTAGTHLVIAPDVAPAGELSADLATLQADPATDTGRRYIAEAIRLFGPGVVPSAAGPGGAPEPAQSADMRPFILAIAGAAIVVFGGVALVARRQAG